MRQIAAHCPLILSSPEPTIHRVSTFMRLEWQKLWSVSLILAHFYLFEARFRSPREASVVSVDD